MPHAHRHLRAARLAGPPAPLVREYRIIHPLHKPDLRGELGGVKVQSRGAVKVVLMTDAQARFYIDQGVIELLKPVVAAAKAAGKS